MTNKITELYYRHINKFSIGHLSQQTNFIFILIYLDSSPAIYICVYECVCVCVCVCVYVCVCIYTCVCLYIFPCLSVAYYFILICNFTPYFDYDDCVTELNGTERIEIK